MTLEDFESNTPKKEELKIKKKTQYEIMSSAWKKNFMPTDEEIETLSAFIFCRFISNDIIGVSISNFLNNYPNIPKKQMYNFARALIPNNVKYIKYPKEEQIANKKQIDILIEYYKCNAEIAQKYFKILSKEEYEKIENMIESTKTQKIKKVRK